MNLSSRRFLAAFFAALLAAGAGVAAASDDGDDPVVVSSKTSQALQKLPRKPLADRVAVAIYQFRSSVQSVTPASAADIFTTALVDSGQFRVVERSQLNQTVVREKQLNGAGLSSGTSAQKQLRGAQYLFEGTVSEGTPSQDQKQAGINVGGLNLGASKNDDSIAVDVRILDADTGDVLDSVTVRKTIKSQGGAVGGTAAFASTVGSLFGKSVPALTPDVNLQTAHSEGVDKALRACIETSVMELIKRLPAAAAGG